MRRHLSTEQTILIGFVASLAVLAIVAFTSYRTTSELIESSRLMAHSQTLRRQLVALQASTKEAESGARGFLVSGNPELAADLDDKTAAARALAAEIRREVSDNPAQIKHLDELAPLLDQRFALLSQAVEVRRTKGLEAARHIAPTGYGLRLARTIESVIHQMDDNESQLLETRRQQTLTLQKRTFVVQTAGFVLALLIALGAIVKTLRDAARRREVERMKDEFISVVSHELRTPLTAIRGSLGLLNSGRLSVEQPQGKRMLEIAVSSTDRLVRLINDILDIERIESGRVAMQKTPCSAAELLASVEESMSPLAQRAGVTIEVRSEAAVLFADSDRLVQTLTNLTANAIKFSPNDSVVTLSAQVRPGDVLFSVADQGRGIPAEKRDLVFERFKQLDTSDARDKGGAGLGLAISRSIVLQHGGQIWVEDGENGAGSIFRFTIPADNAAQLPSTEPIAAHP